MMPYVHGNRESFTRDGRGKWRLAMTAHTHLHVHTAPLSFEVWEAPALPKLALRAT